MTEPSSARTPLVYSVEGLDCPDCALKLEQGIAALPQVAEARLDFTLARLEVTPRLGDDPTPSIQRLAQGLGHRVRPAETAGDSPQPEAAGGTLGDIIGFLRQHRRDALTAMAGLVVIVAFALDVAVAPPWLSNGLYGLAILIGGFYVARSGMAALLVTRSPDMNLLMTIAAVGAAIIGEWEEAAVVMFLFSLGNTLESYTMDRARRAIRSLMALSPKVATRLTACLDCPEHLGQPLDETRGNGDQGARNNAAEGGEGPAGDGTRTNIGSCDRQTPTAVCGLPSAVYAGGPCPWCGTHEEQVPLDRLAVDDLILVRPGERVPTDGAVSAGASSLDQSPITGESLPVEKGVGAAVYAGSINGSGALIVRVTRLAKDNTLARIIQMVEKAQAQKAASQRFVDVFARYYTPAVIGVAALVAVVPPLAGLGSLDTWVYRALVLLVISCPCALVISTPVSIVAAIANAARNGVLIKGGAHLEAAGQLNAIALDKTGTLTKGRPVVTDVFADGAATPHEVLRLAAAIESRSEHPLAEAVLAEVRARGIEFKPGDDFTVLPGQGARATVDGRTLYVGSHMIFDAWRNHSGRICQLVDELENQGKTVMIVGHETETLGLIAVADTLRPQSKAAVAALKAAGIRRTVMLTGDNQRVAQAIAGAAGVDEVRAGLLPENKVAAMEELLAAYGKVGMVGDGVNDAPALARATVGIAMGAIGTDAALETADIALMGDDLSRLPFAIGLSRQARRIIQQNIALALAIKGVFLLLALPGLATLWMAVFADMGASLIVTLNGMRLLAYGRQGAPEGTRALSKT